MKINSSKAKLLANPDCEICHGEGIIEVDYGGGDIQEKYCECVVENPKWDDVMNGEPDNFDQDR